MLRDNTAFLCAETQDEMYSSGRRRIIYAGYVDSKRLGFVHCVLCCCQCFKDSDKLGETHHNILWEFVQTCSELEYFLLQTVFVIQTSTYFTDCQIF